MESDHAMMLRAAERGAAAPFIDYPSLPSWYPLAVGTWGGLLIVAISQLSENPGLAIPLALSLLIVEFAAFRWYRSRWGVWPRMRDAPPEIAEVYRKYFAGLALLALAVAGSSLVVGVVPAAIVACVLITVGLAVYERAYEHAATVLRRRLGA